MDTPFFKTQFFMGEKIIIEYFYYLYILISDFIKYRALKLLFVEKNIINEI